MYSSNSPNRCGLGQKYDLNYVVDEQGKKSDHSLFLSNKEQQAMRLNKKYIGTGLI